VEDSSAGTTCLRVEITRTVNVVDEAPLTLDVDPVEPGARASEGSPPPAAPQPPLVEWTNAKVAWVVVATVVVGVLTGLVVFRTDPDLELLEAREQLRDRDETIAELQGLVAVLEAELARVSPDAIERARLEQELAARRAELDQRQAAIEAREQELEGLWTIPRFEIPDADAIGRFLDRLSSFFNDAVGGEDALEGATAP
jgi:hypothetical protein